MPLLPDTNEMNLIQAACMSLFDEGESLGAMDICGHLMALEQLPVHCPSHHFLLPAALLTSAHIRSVSPREKLASDLAKARDRSKDIPGGICGNHGCCGAAIGAGIFASIWRGTNPLHKEDWASGARITASALESIGSVDGPRCCFLSLRAAIPAIRREMQLDLGDTNMVCAHFSRSRECKKEACPFYPQAEF